MASNGALGLISSIRRTFVTFGIPNELVSDGGPEFTATATRQFLEDWGVHHRLSSVAFPHSNCRVEVGVKTVKRLISDKPRSAPSPAIPEVESELRRSTRVIRPPTWQTDYEMT